MSFSLSGTLNVIERNGRNGPFTVAELNTDVGVFKIKHRVLEQFDQGAYSGVFIVTRIYNQSNFSKGQIWVSLCADLDWDALQIMAQSEQAPRWQWPKSSAKTKKPTPRPQWLPLWPNLLPKLHRRWVTMRRWPIWLRCNACWPTMLPTSSSTHRLRTEPCSVSCVTL